jgi:hypothetical protein
LPWKAETQVLSKDADTSLSKYYTTSDTIIIPSRDQNALKFSKKEFNELISRHPELVSEDPFDPDYAYLCQKYKADFESESGQDSYYILYSYFLKHKHSEEEYSAMRNRLIDIYTVINSIFGEIRHGGSGFGHLYERIPAYAEFSISVYKDRKDDYENTYDFTNQKVLYLKLLRQFVKDEVLFDRDNWIIGKTNRIQELNKINRVIDKLDKLISSMFYLTQAQQFHYKNY